MTAPRWLLFASALLFSSCEAGAPFTVGGYSTQPLHRTDIHTVRVPIFRTLAYRDATRHGMEVDLTRAVVREIQQKTPYRVVGPGEAADTELSGTLVFATKNVLTRNQLNEIREGQTQLRIDVSWTDLRSGDVLSAPRRRPDEPPSPIGPDGQPVKPPPVSVFADARFIPELGESPTTAYQRGIDRLATQIVAMMEAPW